MDTQSSHVMVVSTERVYTETRFDKPIYRFLKEENKEVIRVHKGSKVLPKTLLYLYCHALEWLQMGYGLVIGITEHLQIVTASNYNAITTLLHSTVHYSMYWVLSVCCLFTSHLVTASNAITTSTYSAISNPLCSLFTRDLHSSAHMKQLTASSSVCHLKTLSQSYIMTGSQSASLSWCQAPIWNPWPIFSPSLFDHF
jgi:hypothetical protein